MDIKELNKTQLILLSLLITFIVSIATGIVTVSLMQQMPKSVPKTINNIIQRTIEKVTTIQVPAPNKTNKNNINKNNSFAFIGDGNVLVSIYAKSYAKEKIIVPITNSDNSTKKNNSQADQNNSNNIKTTNTDSTNNNLNTTTVSKVPSGNSTAGNKSVDKTSKDNTTKVEQKILKSPKNLGQGIIISDVGLILAESSILKGYDNLEVTLDKTEFAVSILKKFNNGFTILKIISKQDEKKMTKKKESSSSKVKTTVSNVDKP